MPPSESPFITVSDVTLRFGATGEEASLVRCGLAGEDVNGDGLRDLVCHFDKSDMHRVKEVLSEKYIIAGNVPASLMATGSTDDVRAYCASLMDLFGDAPGYIMTHGCYFENTTDEKICAFIDAVKK